MLVSSTTIISYSLLINIISVITNRPLILFSLLTIKWKQLPSHLVFFFFSKTNHSVLKNAFICLSVGFLGRDHKQNYNNENGAFLGKHKSTRFRRNYAEKFAVKVDSHLQHVITQILETGTVALSVQFSGLCKKYMKNTLENLLFYFVL